MTTFWDPEVGETRYGPERVGVPMSAVRSRSFPELLDDQHPKAASIEQRFAAFHAGNPWVYDELVRLSRQLVRLGRRKLGIGMLWEVLRWQYYLDVDDPSSDFRLNDHYRSRYARLIMETEVDLAGVFEIRGLRAE